MHIGQRSMANSQTALHTVSHNVANKETEGYSRQSTENLSNFPYGKGNVRIGTGAKAVKVGRTVNPYLEKQLANQMSELAYHKGKADGMARLEQVYNELAVEGLNVSMVKFFNSFKELSTNPESMPKRMTVKENADLMARDFNRVSKQIGEVRGDANSGIAISVNEVNAITDELARLNMQVQTVELGGGRANDERDRRDLLLKKLGEHVDIRWSEGPDSDITVSMSNNAVLVVNGEAHRLEAVPTPASGDKAEGDYDVLYFHHAYADPLVITERIEGGRLGGLIQTRDGDVKDYKDRVDAMAYTIATQVNDLHTQGYNAFNQLGGEFFRTPESQLDAAELMSIDPGIMGDVGRIATAMDPDRPGDNRIALMLGSLQHKKAFFDGETSVDEFYNGLVAELGVRTEKVNHQVEVQQGMVDQLANLRESVSGVSVDEEMAEMMEWQKQFNASARVVRTADEMLETVLSIRG